MQLSNSFRVLAFLTLAATTFGAPQKRQPVGAAYFMTNNEEQNDLVIHNVFSDGTVAYARSVSTGEKGAANLLVGPPTADSLRTENAIVVKGNMLFNVNPGSDTVTMWQINPTDPTQLKMVGKPVNTGGNFPGSVAVSKKGHVCVANGGTVNGVQCFNVTPSGLQPLQNTNRILGFPQTTPATQNDSLASMSTILFSADETKLVVDVKGFNDHKVPGYIAAWDVMQNGSLSKSHDTFPAPSNIGAQPFGMTNLHGIDGYLVSDPTVGGIIYDFSKGYTTKDVKTKNIALPGQQITCWATYASKSNSYFMTDFGGHKIFEISVANKTLDTKVNNIFQLPNTTSGLDTVTGTLKNKNQYLYQLAGFGSSLFVFDVQPAGKTKMIQGYNFSQSLSHDKVKFSQFSPVGLAFYAKP